MRSRQNGRSVCPAQRALATLAASDNPHVLDEREGPGLGRLHMTGGVPLASPLPPPYPRDRPILAVPQTSNPTGRLITTVPPDRENQSEGSTDNRGNYPQSL